MSKPDIPARRVAATVLRYGLAVLFVAVALVVTLLLPHNVLVSPLFFPAVMLSAWFGGIGPGLLSALLASDRRFFSATYKWPLPARGGVAGGGLLHPPRRCGQITNFCPGASHDRVSSGSAPISTIYVGGDI
jgi:hypothetical protein